MTAATSNDAAAASIPYLTRGKNQAFWLFECLVCSPSEIRARMLHDERKTGSKFGGGEADLEHRGKPIYTAADSHNMTYCMSITEKLFAPLSVC